MTLFDVIRFTSIATFGVGVGFMTLTNLISYQVLRPPKKLGFLWWHVTCISLSFLCLGFVSVQLVASKLGDPPSWRGAVVMIGTTLFMLAQIIIFSVERTRLVHQKAAKAVEARIGAAGDR